MSRGWRGEGASVASCEACGNESPEVAAFCGGCGHRLGETPQEPIKVNLRVVNSACSGCLSCFTTAVTVVVLIFFALWIFSC